MILLIDDDLDDCDIFCEALKDVSNEQCTYIHQPHEAIRFLHTCTTYPSCIFLDVNLPPTNGFAILQAIKADEKLSSIPVIMFSTSGSKKDIEKSRELGAHLYIQKSNSYTDLVNNLNKIKSIF